MSQPNTFSFPHGLDIFGDIHGHADALRGLLKKLGYRIHQGAYRHPAGRKAFFLGDLLDRGPKIRETVHLVRAMVTAGEARMILGNHEMNALRYHHYDRMGKPLRAHEGSKRRQHQPSLDQFADPHPDEWRETLDWFAEQPLWADLGPLRLVHACWDPAALATLDGHGPLRGENLERLSRKGTVGAKAVERILNGPEALLPAGHEQILHDGSRRPDIRIRWWEGYTGQTCREWIFPANPEIPDLPPVPRSIPKSRPYGEEEPLLFFGHYAITGEIPGPILPNLACLDYGLGKEGNLVAYRWNGERQLRPEHFIQ
ncbi:MAG: metallophosphoesterase [Opitutales bacterium]|nr:metallophosphoesterase [Opitutales bacterium]